MPGDSDSAGLYRRPPSLPRPAGSLPGRAWKGAGAKGKRVTSQSGRSGEDAAGRNSRPRGSGWTGLSPVSETSGAGGRGAAPPAAEKTRRPSPPPPGSPAAAAQEPQVSRVRRLPEHQVSWERRPRRAGRDGDVSSRRRHKAGGSGPRTSAPWKGHRWDWGASCCVSARRPLRCPRKVSGGSWRPGYWLGPPGWVGAAAGVSPHLCRATPPGRSPIGKPRAGTSGAGGHLRQSRPRRPGRGARRGARRGAAGDSEMLLKSRSQPL